ncbi:MAG: PadR family transcriptional regulator [Candidatus Thorarchaeota archaeon]|nr:MAG: PadR family transcriptional regulator [Candidatus Thorarchaeota archaeon]
MNVSECDEDVRMPHTIPRGLLRLIVMTLLKDQDMTGSEIMDTLAKRHGGKWRPSPGSIYPLLESLSEKGLIEVVGTEGRSKTYGLTEVGKAHIKAAISRKGDFEHKARLGRSLWLNLLEPGHRAHFFVSGMNATLELLGELVPELSPAQKSKIYDRLGKLAEKLGNLQTHFKTGA